MCIQIWLSPKSPAYKTAHWWYIIQMNLITIEEDNIVYLVDSYGCSSEDNLSVDVLDVYATNTWIEHVRLIILNQWDQLFR